MQDPPALSGPAPIEIRICGEHVELIRLTLYSLIGVGDWLLTRVSSSPAHRSASLLVLTDREDRPRIITGTVLRLALRQVSRGGNSVARIPKVKHKAVMIGIITLIVLGLAALLYFVFREHFASAVVALAAFLIAAASLLVAVIQVFQGWSSKKDTSSVVVPGHDPNEYSKPKFPMTPMRRPSNSESSPGGSAGQQT